MEREEAYKKGETPDYYTGKYKGIKAIDVIHDFELAHCKASALEYILRSGKKDDEVQDLRKAINHLQMQIDFIEQVDPLKFETPLMPDVTWETPKI